MMGKQTMPVPTTRRGLYLRILMSKRVPVLPHPPYSLGLGCTTTSQTDPPPPRLHDNVPDRPSAAKVAPVGVPAY